MPQPPEQVYIESRDKDETFGESPVMRAQEVVLKGENRHWTYYKPESEAVDLVPGLELEVWKNHQQGKITVAASRHGNRAQSQPESQGVSQGGSQQQLQTNNDPRQDSIERQVAAKAAAEIMANAQGAYVKGTFAEDFKFMFEAVLDQITDNKDKDIPF